MRSSDCSSDVCSSDLQRPEQRVDGEDGGELHRRSVQPDDADFHDRLLAGPCGGGAAGGKAQRLAEPVVALVAIGFDGSGELLAHFLKKGVSILLHGDRSEERRVGKECVSTCRYRLSPYH